MPTDLNRRTFLYGSAFAMLAATAEKALAQVNRTPQCRVIVDNDFAGDPDGLVALAHQLASRASRCVGITTSTLDPGLAAAGGLKPGATAAAGAQAARELIGLMGIDPRDCPVAAGSETIGPDAAQPSAAVKLIVAEALRDDPLPLVFACGGPLTNLAQALRIRPDIAGRMKLIWIGGGAYPAGGHEYNLATDAKAAQAVFGHRDLSIWQVPLPAYERCLISIEDFEANLRPISATTQWLYRRYAQLPPFVKLGGVIGFGDSALVLLTALSDKSSPAHDRTARAILDDGRYGEEIAGRFVKVFDEIDMRLLLSDFMAAMRTHG